MLDDLHLPVEPALFRQIADAVARVRAAPATRWSPQSGRKIPVIMRMVVVFPAPFRQEPGDRAPPDGERDTVHRPNRTEGLDDVTNGKDLGHATGLYAGWDERFIEDGPA